MKATEVATNAVGKVARITMGMDNEKSLQEGKDLSSGYACWRHLGETGEITAVYLNSDRSLCFLLKLSDSGKLVEVAATFCTMT